MYFVFVPRTKTYKELWTEWFFTKTLVYSKNQKQFIDDIGLMNLFWNLYFFRVWFFFSPQKYLTSFSWMLLFCISFRFFVSVLWDNVCQSQTVQVSVFPVLAHSIRLIKRSVIRWVESCVLSVGKPLNL